MWIWAALVCYNTACLPPVAKIDPPPARVACPQQFRAKNYAQSTGGAETWSVVCAESGSLVYGGLSFYAGEGITGTGGLLRLNRDTKKIELRRPPILRDVSINSIAAEGGVVWFGTTQQGECEGVPFVHGLVRYDWKSGDIKTYEGSDDGPVGFVIDAIALRDSALWAETDLGLSRLDLETDAWHHYDSKRRERTVKEIVEPLLRTVPRECLRSDIFENQLVEGLARFRPLYLDSYLRNAGASKWQCPELRFMTARMPDFATLDRRVLRFHPPGSALFRCAVQGFATHKHVEKKWRDLLVNEWRKHPDSFTPEAFRFFRGDMEIARMLVAARSRAIVVVPQIAGEAAIPLLAPLLDNPRSTDIAGVIYGLELASHKRITPDGETRTIADAGSFHDFLEQRWWKWSAVQREAVVAAWSKLILPRHER